MSKKLLILLILITVLGFLIRIYKITSSPSGFYIDEVSIGYNAFSILQTGKDEHGKFMPLFFEAFGEWKLPVYIYSVVLAQMFFSPNDFSVRLPAVLFGTLTIPFLFFWVREMLIDKFPKNRNSVAIFSALILTFSQWHFQYTHAGFEASAAIFFTTAGLFFFFKAKNQKSLLFLILYILSFCLSLYSYNSSKVVIPVLTVLLFISYFKSFKFYHWLIGIIIGLGLLFPFIKFSMSDPGMTRIKQVGIFYQSYITDPWHQLLKNYLVNVSPQTLFVRGEPTIISQTSHRTSLVNPIESLFIVLGILILLRKFSRISILTIIYLLIGFLPAALSTFPPHALRSSLTIPVITFISGLGMGYFYDLIKNFRIKIIFTGLLIIFLTFWSIHNLYIYHNLYVSDSGSDWQTAVKKTSEYIKLNEDKYPQIYIDNNAGAKISFLWYLRYSPYEYQHLINKSILGKYYFIDLNETVNLTKGSLYINNGQTIDGILMQTIDHPNMSLANAVWIIK